MHETKGDAELVGEIEVDLVNLARLASTDAQDDVRLYIARLVRKYRQVRPSLAAQLDGYLRSSRARSSTTPVLRRVDTPPPVGTDALRPPMPIDKDSQLRLLRVFDDTEGIAPPLLSPALLREIQGIVQERRERERLQARGIRPTKSAILFGPPGVGKTLTARWIASQLGKPLWVLDLTAVMSSLLGRTGNNVRAALDYAKESSAVLLLDEIDAIAKRRGDDSDIGELKRLVTVILQEVDHWPDTGLLLGATNHPELIDPALWRRFDAVLEFGAPDSGSVRLAVERYLGPDIEVFGPWLPVLAQALQGKSISDVERVLLRLRRGLVLSDTTVEDLVRRVIEADVGRPEDKGVRLNLAVELARTGLYPHTEISRLTGVARDTIRKHAGPSPRKGRGMKE